MARSVTYSVVPRFNPHEKSAPPRYYAQAQSNGDVDVREMSERIQASCTVTKADVYAVLVSLEDVIIDALKAGEIVRLGDLGTFRIGLNGKGALSEEEYDTSLIQKAHINFRPGMALAGCLTSLTYTRVAKKAAKKAEESEEMDNETSDESTEV